MTTILITAGETSGDILGAEIMRELKAKRKDLTFTGIGGPHMLKEGLKPLGSIEVFPGMGIAEILPAIPAILCLLGRLARWSKRHKPDLLLTIDNQDFSARLAKKLSAQGIPCVHYVAPKVWAWRQHRVVKLKSIFSHILCLFPFEVGFFTDHGLEATYIGHPVALRLAALTPEALKLNIKKDTLALLPGSRRAELKHHWPLFLETFRLLRKKSPALKGIVALPDDAAVARCKAIGWAEGISPVVGESRFQVLGSCTAALTKSGTNNLELALLGVPAVVAYRMNNLTYKIVKRLVKVPAISPVNLVANGLEAPTGDRPHTYPEFIQDAATPAALAKALGPLLEGGKAAEEQRKSLAAVRKKLATKASPAALAAQVVLSYLR